MIAGPPRRAIHLSPGQRSYEEIDCTSHRDTEAQRKASFFQFPVPLCLCGERFVA